MLWKLLTLLLSSMILLNGVVPERRRRLLESVASTSVAMYIPSEASCRGEPVCEKSICSWPTMNGRRCCTYHQDPVNLVLTNPNALLKLQTSCYENIIENGRRSDRLIIHAPALASSLRVALGYFFVRGDPVPPNLLPSSSFTAR